MRTVAPLLAALLLAGGCRQPTAAEPSPQEERPAPPGTTAAAPVPAPATTEGSGPPAPVSVTTGLALPEAFTAIGTEPFWAAKVTKGRLTYSTPEDQAGQTVAVTRTAAAQSVELRGTLGGKPLALVITKGPCSDGMSDTVYPFAVVRRLGEDEQRGCARQD